GTTTRSFGNVNVQINTGNAAITSMTVKLVKMSPPDAQSAVDRTYTITQVSGGTPGATSLIRLRYLDSELHGNAEATLELWKKIAGTWTAQGQTSRDSSANWVEKINIGTFSDWIINGPTAPTAVAMVNMKATRYDDRVLLEWQTGYEVGNVGFNIYREQNGKLTKVTPDPVAGSALIAGPKVLLRAGFAYSWWDNEAKSDDSFVQYWLEDIDVSGRTLMRGPYGIEQPRAGDKAPPSGKKSSSLSALGPEASKRGSTVLVEPMAGVVKLTPELLEAQATVASSPAIKLSVQHEGWYRVQQLELVAAGFSADVDPRKLQLFVDGQQAPIIVIGEKDGNFDRTDAVEFYGIGINSASTANHVYWLIAGSQKGQRIKSVGGKGTSPAPPSFSYTVERRDKVIYFSAIKNGGAEKFFGPLIYNAQPVDQSLVLQNIAASGNASLEVSLQGFTLTPHSVKVLFNGAELTTIQFDGQAKGTATLSIPQTSLIEGNNQVQLVGPAGFSDMSLVEYVRLTYQHTNNADGDELRFPATGKQLASIGGFTNSAVRVVDVTNPNSVEELVGTVKQTGSTFTISAVVPGVGAKTLLAFAAGQQETPAAMVLDEPSSWRTHGQAADYVAITRKDLVSSIQPLKTQRQSQGLLVAVVDVEDVYDEFSFGNKSPQALKDFLSYAKTSWTKAPRFVLFAGDATYDPKNYTGVGDFDLVPTKLIETANGETATDDWFVDINGDGVPDMAIGRLPVRTDQETASLVSKIVGYDSSAAIPRVLLVADHNEGYDFEAADTQLQSLIPGNLTVTDIRRGQVGDADARSQLIDAINQGTKLVNYYGHGSVRVWTDAPILTADDAANFVNTNGLALFNAMTCLNGFFHDVSVDSLGEALLKAPGGAIAVWASSGLTEPSSQVPMSEEAVRLLFNGA
ncbi:MAG TPA: C25 family cysteine peptidase, partial [Blastocatellia bacterium]|nr:C25 family cysteine peptidase [Blastocatellia bacterium]